MGKMKYSGRWIDFAWATVLVLAASVANAQSPADDAVVEAVWKPQRMNFVYRGYSTLYSCRRPAGEAGEDPEDRRCTRPHRAARLLVRRRAVDRALPDRADLAGRGYAGEHRAAHDIRRVTS